MEARTESPLHNPLLDLREMEERVRMHEEEDSETQDRIVEEDGEDDVISSTTPECSRNVAFSNQEDNDQQPERPDNMQNNEFDEAQAASLENETTSIGIGETNDNSPVPAPDATGDAEDFDSSFETGSPSKSSVLDLSYRGEDDESDGRKEENLLEIDPQQHCYNNDLVISDTCATNKEKERTSSSEKSPKAPNVYVNVLSFVSDGASDQSAAGQHATDATHQLGGLDSSHPADKSAPELPPAEMRTSSPVPVVYPLPKTPGEIQDCLVRHEAPNFHKESSSLVSTRGLSQMSLSHAKEKASALQSRPLSIPPPGSVTIPAKLSHRAPSLPPGGPEQNPELSKNDTISGSIFAHHPTAVRLTPMGGIACTPIQRLLQNGLTEARQEASAPQRVEVRAPPPAGDAGASTSAAGRHSADEKPMSRQDQEKATEMRSDNIREEVNRTNPCLIESGCRNKECSENEAMTMEKRLQNDETLSERSTSNRKRERDENEATLSQLIPEEENGEIRVHKKSNQGLVLLQREEEQKKQPVQEKPPPRETDDDKIHHDISIDEADGGQDEVEDQEDNSGEIVMNLDQVSGGQKMKFNIPGISQVIKVPRFSHLKDYLQAVTVNFSVEALQEMKNAALRQRVGGGGSEVQQSEEISSSQVSSFQTSCGQADDLNYFTTVENQTFPNCGFILLILGLILIL